MLSLREVWLPAVRNSRLKNHVDGESRADMFGGHRGDIAK